MHRIRTLALLVLAALTLSIPALATAKSHAKKPAPRTHVRVGIADQSPAMFDAKAYKALKLKISRYFIHWDAAKHPDQLALADAFINKARADHVSVLLHISTPNLKPKKAYLPTVGEYKKWVGALVKRYRPAGVKEWGAWNEENNKTQPTYRSAPRAASYFKAMRQICRGCTIVALDIQDQSGATGYIQRFYHALGGYRKYARIVGIHNYSDTNRLYRHGSGTRAIINLVKHYNRATQFWLTETGGVVNFGRAFPCNRRHPRAAESRQNRAEANMFNLAREFRSSIKRLYVYNWRGSGCVGMDVGLTRPNGSLRPSYSTFKKYLARFDR